MYTREFYLNTITQVKSEPARLMAREIYGALSDGPYSFNEMVADASMYTPQKSVKSWIYGAAKHGLIEITGSYIRHRGAPVEDTRMVALKDWPVPDALKREIMP
jgi:hypothetical protein